jgi:hypothetical protein
MTSLDQQMKKGMGYGELIVDNIIGLDNEYESFGEKLGKAINEDEIGFLKNAAVGIYEGAKEFVTNPVETTKEVITDIKDSVQRLGSEDLDTRLQSMYGISYDQATDQQVTSAREAVIGDAMTALELIPAAKAATVTAKAASSAIPSGVKADIVGQTKAVFGGDMEFLRGTPTERSSTVGVGAQRADKPTLQFETSSGSTYDQFKNATTIRNRAERDDNEVSGVQPRSGKTVFMNKESIDTIGPLFQNTEIPVQFIPLEGNKAKLIYTEDYGPKKAGEDASNVVQFTTSPRMGLYPVEIMDSKNTDKRNIHFGNEIVKIRSASKKDKETKKEPKVSFAPLVRPNEKKTAHSKAMDIRESAAIRLSNLSPEEQKTIEDMNLTKLESSDFYSSILPGVASLDIPEGGIKGSKVKDFLEKDNNISNTQLYWSGLFNEIDSDTIYDKDTLVNLARQNIPKIEIVTNTGSAGARYRDLQRIPLVEDSSTDKFVTKQSLPVPAHIRFEGQPGAEKDSYKELIAINKNPKGNFYQAAESHWGYGGTAVAHTRLSEYTHNGNKFAVVEELQSDMAQVATDDRNKNLEVATKENSTNEIPLTAGDISDSLINSSSDLVSNFYITEAPSNFKFTNRFEQELENISQTFYNKSFNDLASEQEFVEVSEAVLSDLMFQFANLKFKYENNEINLAEVMQKITTNMPGITERVLARETYENLVSTPIDKIFSNAFSDYVFGKSTIKKNRDLKYKIADLFDTAPSIADFKKANLSMLKQSEATRVSLLMAIKDAKENNINKIYVVPPKTAAYYHSFSEDTADKIYNSTLNKVLKTLSTETNNAVKYQRKNPEGIRFPISKPIGRAGSWEFDDDQIAMEIDITDFNLPDKPQFRLFKGGLVNKFDRGGLAVSQTEQMMGMPTSGDPAIIDPTTGQPYDALGSMRQQAEQTRQVEAKEEFDELKLPENIQKEVEEQIRPRARPEGLPNVYENRTAVDKVLDLGFLLKQKQKDSRGLSKVVSGLDENNPVHQKTIKGFFDNAVGGDTGFDPTKEAWCAAFVNHVLTELGADLINSKDPYDKIRANKYKEYGEPVELENIQEGDIVVFDFDKDGTADHVTFYAGSRVTDQGQGQYINVIGGNQGGKVSIRENHPYYILDNVAAIRRVTYDGDAYEIAQSHKDSDPIFKTFLPEEHEEYALNLQGNYNKGGMTMNGQMEMAFMQQGGLKDDGMKQDPVSGNQIPNGSMAKEVRDDIPAQLSEGEYVVPADVVRYLGVKHFEDLRDKAKSGLQNMEANGRIGGEPVPASGPSMQPPQPMQPPTPYSPPQMAMGGDLSPEEMNEITSMMNQGGMARSAYYGGGFSNTNTSFYNPDATKTAEAVSTPTRYTGSFSNLGRQTFTPAPVVAEVPGAGSTTPVQVETPATCAARGMVYDEATKMCRMPVSQGGGDDNAAAEKKRLQDMVNEHQKGSQVAIADMNQEQLLEAYQGAEMGKYITSGLMALNPVVGGIARLFAGNESKKIQAALKERYGVTKLPEVDYKKGGIIGNILGGTSLLDVLDNAIVSLQEGKIGAGTSTYKAQFNPPNSAQYSNNLQQSTGSIWGSEQEAYDSAVRSGNYQVANHFEAINRLRGKQNNFYDSTKGMTKMEAYAEGRKDGLSVHDMDQAFKYGGSLGRAISSGVVEKEGFLGKYEFKDGKTVDDVQTGTTEKIVPSAPAYTPTVPSGGPGTFDVSDNNDDGPNAAQIAAAKVQGDKIDKEQKEKIISSGDTYSTDTSTAIQQMRDRGTFNVGGRATGGLVSRPKKKKK